MGETDWLWLICTQRCENHVSSRFLLIEVRVLRRREVMLLPLSRGVPLSSQVLVRENRLFRQLCGCDSSASARDGAEAEAAALGLQILSSAILLSVDAVRRDYGLAGVRGLHGSLLNLATVARVAVHWESKWSNAYAAACLLLIAVVMTLRVGHLLLQELLIVILLLLYMVLVLLLVVAM